MVDRLKGERHRGTTRKNYRCVWRTFNQFFIRQRIILFVGYLVDCKKQSSTIKSYISAIKVVLAEDGVQLNQDQFLLNAMTKACRLINDKVRTRLPIRKPTLTVLLQQIKQDVLKDQPYLASLYCAILASAYFGLLRIGEVTTGDHPVLAKDVHIADNKQKIMFILRTSKTHWRNDKPQIIKITSFIEGRKKVKEKLSCMDSAGLTFCPYETIRKYIKKRGPYADVTEPFFVFSDHSPVKPAHVRRVLKEALVKAGFDERLYFFHSLRIGRGTDLASFGLSVETIKKVGRWASNAVFRYLRD